MDRGVWQAAVHGVEESDMPERHCARDGTPPTVSNPWQSTYKLDFIDADAEAKKMVRDLPRATQLVSGRGGIQTAAGIALKYGFFPWCHEEEKCILRLGFPGSSDGKESACYVGYPDSVPQLRRSSREGDGYQIQHFCLENPSTGEPGRL